MTSRRFFFSFEVSSWEKERRFLFFFLLDWSGFFLFVFDSPPSLGGECSIYSGWFPLGCVHSCIRGVHHTSQQRPSPQRREVTERRRGRIHRQTDVTERARARQTETERQKGPLHRIALDRFDAPHCLYVPGITTWARGTSLMGGRR